MTITPHLLLGAALATRTSSYPVAFLLGFLSHFVIDALPHVDPGTFNKIEIPGVKEEIKLPQGKNEQPWPLWIYIFAFSEAVIIFSLFYIFFHQRTNFLILVVGGLGGIFMDIMDNPIFLPMLKLPVLRNLHWLHHRVHYDIPAKKWYLGLIIELIIIGGSLWLLLKF